MIIKIMHFENIKAKLQNIKKIKTHKFIFFWYILLKTDRFKINDNILTGTSTLVGRSSWRKKNGINRHLSKFGPDWFINTTVINQNVFIFGIFSQYFLNI